MWHFHVVQLILYEAKTLCFWPNIFPKKQRHVHKRGNQPHTSPLVTSVQWTLCFVLWALSDRVIMLPASTEICVLLHFWLHSEEVLSFYRHLVARYTAAWWTLDFWSQLLGSNEIVLLMLIRYISIILIIKIKLSFILKCPK